MLSSTARNLYWMARYIERAENTARVLDAATRMALMLPPDATKGQEMVSVATIYGCEAALAERHPQPTIEDLLRYMAIDPENPSSIYCSVQQARNNARAERNNLTTDVWETLNGFWLELDDIAKRPDAVSDERGFLDWVKKQSQLVTGAGFSTLLRDEAFSFLSLGTFVERADSTARILDVKYHILLPTGEPVGGAIDYHQWSEVLASVSAFRTFRRVYTAEILPWRVAELMILHRDLPRSLHFCHRQIHGNLEELAEAHGRRHEAHRMSGEIYSQLRYGKIDRIFQSGLHEFLDEFVARNAQLSNEIEKNFLMI